MRRALSTVALGTVILLGPAFAGDDPDAMNAIMCGHVQAVALDDHISDARTVATAIFSYCRNDMLTAYKKMFPKADAEAELQSQKQGIIDVLVAYVLKARAGRSPVQP
ncbi:hypothetical protein ASC80_01695 [Afipia sp. Root123D2]|uniref:hypothetical protein n=1 Tax=Afipia sp. Root123D2 TaxID=1736436 RepID=UPI0006F6EA9A|nr:hypothetical protein [Afipia sp. Root123D2]KQW22136.1 hypothetical protein ASC80_01695 [Afipia sp. Root123D2]